MLTLFLLSLSLNEYKRERFNLVVKKLEESKEVNSDIPPEIFPELVDAVKTVLFKDGQNLTEVNNISDAIIHCRGGSGVDVPAGKGLLREMEYFESYKNFFNGENGTLIKKIEDQLKTLSSKNDEGLIEGSGSVVLICLTLGHYSPFYKYSIPFKCESVDGIRSCKAEGDVVFNGVDVWDFEPLSTYTWWQNLIFEIIPEFLVLLRGPSVPFGVHFENSIHYNLVKNMSDVSIQ